MKTIRLILCTLIILAGAILLLGEYTDTTFAAEWLMRLGGLLLIICSVALTSYWDAAGKLPARYSRLLDRMENLQK